MLKHALRVGALAASVVVMAAGANAQDVTLKLHQMLPPQASIPAGFLTPWGEKVEKDSGGRIKVEHYPSMQLGGKPPALYDQAKDGVVDIIWTLTGYTPGRFPKTEAFEMPFMAASAEATSAAAWDYYEKHLRDEFADTHVLAVHVHGPGLLHMKGDPVTKLEDLKGKKLRGPTRMVNALLQELGAVPVGMPVPAVPEALSKGVIDGTVIPWEVTRPLRIAELVDSHTEFSGDRGFYTAFFVFAMNKDAYEALPADLKKVIDDNSGMVASKWLGRVMDEGDVSGRKIAVERGNPIITLDEAETQRWKDASTVVIDGWIAEMSERGIDGAALIADARALIAKHADQ
ncbi:TRAP transporter substrate-binding protein [Breoghania sp. L-A4]|uniref:TRAP transporter substrate-binding protein n=1 Tax=Breoghania sp. L-A4 TaxID=2304600 RepID=UPI000E35FB08|nr:TRAP transporter substrate-binding protein [Breoghania sp. L-A4]AXS42217.1 C4-dicarboxylate ABC transporter [Breoghania sp. L-A4]